MTHFLLSPDDANMLTDFNTIKDIIKDDDFSFFLDAYKDVIENLDIYKNENSNYNLDGNYLKIKLTSAKWFDCYLIVWGPKAKSKIHDHADNGCVYKMLQGSLTETTYFHINLLERTKKIIEIGEIGEIHNDVGYHSMENLLEAPAVSIHFYSPPNYVMNIFN
jgi:predicted metal-dependent enzyme (double-stranded beta helix superfamily)